MSFWRTLWTASTVGLCCLALGQAGQGRMGLDGSAIDRAIAYYLNTPEGQSILTPGEVSDWPLELAADQVVLAEARSDAFDPAIEILDPAGKVVAQNDDRYPGDQRPLVLWHCTQPGKYTLRVRCFQNKAGGQFLLRSRTFDCVDLSTDKMVEKGFPNNRMFLFRIPMKAGQMRQVVVDTDQGKYTQPSWAPMISPLGLPEVNLAEPLGAVFPLSCIAPVDGDYYQISYYWDFGRPFRAGLKEIVLGSPVGTGDAVVGKSVKGEPSLWNVFLKKGDLIEASVQDVPFSSGLAMLEQPDFASFDATNPEKNPFFPKVGPAQPNNGPALTRLPGRARDPRIAVFYVNRDVQMWMASSGSGVADKPYSLVVKQAPKAFPEGKRTTGKLRIGNTDYWAFDVQAGDVMTLSASASTFAPRFAIREPDLQEVWWSAAFPDQPTLEYRLVARKPGRHLALVSSFGDGGGGDYSLVRKVIPSKEATIQSPIKGELADQQVQVVRFVVEPSKPVLARWFCSNRAYDLSIRDGGGSETSLPFVRFDDNNDYALIKVDRPTTFLLILSGKGGSTTYRLELGPVPGYGK